MENINESEFFKLDSADKKVLFWMMDNKPEDVETWIRYVSRDYNRPEKGLINAEKLYEEVKLELI